MTAAKTVSKSRASSFVILAALLLLGGCGGEVDVFPEPGAAGESAEVLRAGGQGVVIAAFASYPLKPGAPPDGMQAAVVRAMGRKPCSAAAFFWSVRAMAMRWLLQELEARRAAGLPRRVILAGHGLGATSAAETARELMARDPDAEIVLLLTVDAVKTGRIGAAAGVTGAATVGRIPGVNLKFTAYDSAPAPDGQRLWAHINYYQTESALYSGAPMPAAENHRLDDWTGLLNHGNSDNFALPLLVADLRAAIDRGSRW